MKVKLRTIKPFSNGRFPALLLAVILYVGSLLIFRELAEYIFVENVIGTAVKYALLAIIFLLLTELLGQFFICSTLSRFNKRPIFYTFIRSTLAKKREWIAVTFLIFMLNAVANYYTHSSSERMVNKKQQSTLTHTQQSTEIKNTEVINNATIQEQPTAKGWAFDPILILGAFSAYFMIFPLQHLLNVLLLCNDLIKPSSAEFDAWRIDPDSVDKHGWEVKFDYAHEYVVLAFHLAFSSKKLIIYGLASAALGVFIQYLLTAIAIVFTVDPSSIKSLAFLLIFLEFAMMIFISSTIIVALKLTKDAGSKSGPSSCYVEM